MVFSKYLVILNLNILLCSKMTVIKRDLEAMYAVRRI